MPQQCPADGDGDGRGIEPGMAAPEARAAFRMMKEVADPPAGADRPLPRIRAGIDEGEDEVGVPGIDGKQHGRREEEADGENQADRCSGRDVEQVPLTDLRWRGQPQPIGADGDLRVRRYFGMLHTLAVDPRAVLRM